LRSLLAERKVELAPSLFETLPAPLLTQADLEVALKNRQIRADRLRVFMGRKQLDLEKLQAANDDTIDLRVLRQLIDQGATLVFNRLERRIPALHAFAGALADRLGAAIQLTAVLSFSDRSGLAPHHDCEDLFIVQLEGAKAWHFLGQPVRRGLPSDGAEGDDTPMGEHTLKPGDVMFVPAGQRHRCTTSSDISLHLGVQIESLNGALTAKPLEAAILSDPAMLAPYPVVIDPAGRADAVAAYRTRLHELVDQLDLEQLLSAGRPDSGNGSFSFPERRRES
jgi:mannose-6-phosphate isomerase-like protein (cupin superfamily)